MSKSKMFHKKDIYDEASIIIQKAQTKEKSIKSLVYDSNSRNIRQIYALVCEALKYGNILDEIMEKTSFLKNTPWMDRNLALVLLYDYLFGKKLKGSCSGKYRKAVAKQKKELRAALQTMKEEKGAKSLKELLPVDVRAEVRIPRYVRVNLLKTNMQDVIDYFLKAGYTCVLTQEEADAEKEGQSPEFISNLSVDIARSLGEYQFSVDLHLRDVLVFAEGTDFHSHPLYLRGHIILMDKASCFPAHVLSVPPGSHIIDACAAPGNKTSHVASLMGNTGKIYSYDLDAKRVSVMNSLLEKAGVTVAETIHQDFLTSDPNSPTNREVEYIIVDPSCSGSGMVGRKDYLVDETIEGDPARLRSLKQLQQKLLSHALSFPSVKRVVYSTCSIHQEENEDVVNAVLKDREGFRLVPVMADTWDHRGLTGVLKNHNMVKCGGHRVPPLINGKHVDEGAHEVNGSDFGTMCLRASPRGNATNGFFIALFERTETNSCDLPTSSKTTDLRNGSAIVVSDDSSNENVSKEMPQKKKKSKKKGTE